MTEDFLGSEHPQKAALAQASRLRGVWCRQLPCLMHTRGGKKKLLKFCFLSFFNPPLSATSLRCDRNSGKQEIRLYQGNAVRVGKAVAGHRRHQRAT